MNNELDKKVVVMYTDKTHEIKVKSDYLWLLKDRRTRLLKELKTLENQIITKELELNQLKGVL